MQDEKYDENDFGQPWINSWIDNKKSTKFPYPYNQVTGMFEDTKKYGEQVKFIDELNLYEIRKEGEPCTTQISQEFAEDAVKLAGIKKTPEPVESMESRTLTALIDLTHEIRSLREDLKANHKKNRKNRKDKHGFYNNDTKESE